MIKTMTFGTVARVFGFDARPPSPDSVCKTTCLPDPDLMSDRHRAGQMKRIARLVGLPPSHFQRLYHDLVCQFAKHVLSCPTGSNPDERLDYALNVSERALNIRQSYLLPEKTAPEDVARKSDRWTYGVFLAGLLHDLGRSDPVPLENLSAKARSLVPTVGLDWLALEPVLMTSWLAVVTGVPNQGGVIGSIITQAIRQSGGPDLFPDPSDVAPSPELSLLSGLRHLVACGRLRINCDGADAWVTKTDLWLNSKTGLDLIRDWIVDNSEALPPSNNELLDQIQRDGLCLPTPDKNKATWSMLVKWDTGQKRSLLVRFPVSIIWPEPQDRPASFDGEIVLRTSKKDQAKV